MDHCKLLVTSFYLFLLFFCSSQLHAYADCGQTIQGHYEGSYTEGPWFWQRHHNFRFSLYEVTSGRYGKITFYHHKFGSCEGNYILNKNQEDRHERLVVYSSNLSCQKKNQDYFVFQMILPWQLASLQRHSFTSKFYLRSTTNSGLRIQENVTLRYLLPELNSFPLSS